MIVLCIENVPPERCQTVVTKKPIKGNLYEVIEVVDVPEQVIYGNSPFYLLREIPGSIWSYRVFREVDIDINQAEKILQEPLKEFVMV